MSKRREFSYLVSFFSFNLKLVAFIKRKLEQSGKLPKIKQETHSFTVLCESCQLIYKSLADRVYMN